MKIAMLVAFMLIGMIASAADKPARRYINRPRPTMANLPFSEGVLVGGTLYVSGHIGVDNQTGKPPAELSQEIKILLDEFEGVLKEAGMNMDDLVQVTIFCPDLSLYDAFNAAYRTRFKKEFP